MAEQQTSTQSDDVSVPSGNEDAQLSDIIRNSPLAQQAGIVPTPEESLPEAEANPAEEEEAPQDLASEEEAATNEVDETVEEAVSEETTEETKSRDDESTEADSYTLEDLDDIMVTHKINGEEVTQKLSEWIASSATKQSLSKQGREIGELKKAVEEEKQKKLAELDQIGNMLQQSLMGEENKAQEAYHNLSEKIAKAEEADDTYEIGELSKQRSKQQKAYWEARNKRENLTKQLQEQQQKFQQERFQEEVKKFNDNISTHIPEWNENVAKEIREFALEEGLPEQLINVVTEPTLIKFVYDYKNLKKGVTKGAAKRKVVKTLKTPVKKSIPAEKKRIDQEAMVKARAFKQDASKADQDAFLKQYALKSLNST